MQVNKSLMQKLLNSNIVNHSATCYKLTVTLRFPAPLDAFRSLKLPETPPEGGTTNTILLGQSSLRLRRDGQQEELEGSHL